MTRFATVLADPPWATERGDGIDGEGIAASLRRVSRGCCGQPSLDLGGAE